MNPITSPARGAASRLARLAIASIDRDEQSRRALWRLSDVGCGAANASLDVCFANPAGVIGTLAFNGKQAPVIWGGEGGAAAACRTTAFCESAREHVPIGWTMLALEFAQWHPCDPQPLDARDQRQAGVRHLGRGTRQPAGVAHVCFLR